MSTESRRAFNDWLRDQARDTVPAQHEPDPDDNVVHTGSADGGKRGEPMQAPGPDFNDHLRELARGLKFRLE